MELMEGGVSCTAGQLSLLEKPRKLRFTFVFDCVFICEGSSGAIVEQLCICAAFSSLVMHLSA